MLKSAYSITHLMFLEPSLEKSLHRIHKSIKTLTMLVVYSEFCFSWQVSVFP